MHGPFSNACVCRARVLPIDRHCSRTRSCLDHFLYRNTLTVFGFRNTRDTLKRAQGRVDRLANQLRDGNRSPRAYFGHGDTIRPQFSHRNTGEVRLNPFAVYRYHPLDFFNDEADCLAIIIQIAVRERLISRP